jgi:hypothetical protein
MLVTRDLTDREMLLLRVVLSYALSNLDDINEAFSDRIDGWIKLGNEITKNLTEEDVEKLKDKFI